MHIKKSTYICRGIHEILHISRYAHKCMWGGLAFGPLAQKVKKPLRKLENYRFIGVKKSFASVTESPPESPGSHLHVNCKSLKKMTMIYPRVNQKSPNSYM